MSVSLVVGDSSCILWDIEAKQPLIQFIEHSADVMCVSVLDRGINNLSENFFVSGSCDATAKVWDTRGDGHKAAYTFIGHESDINAVQFFPGLFTFPLFVETPRLACFFWAFGAVLLQPCSFLYSFRLF